MANLKYRFSGTGLEKEEYKLAKKLFDDYRKNYSIETFSDLQILEELVYREILQERYKNKVQAIEGAKQENKNLIPKTILNALNENLDKIITLKERLGLFDTKKENDAFKHIKTLEKKFKIWLKENQGSRTLKCPFCSKVIMLKIKTDAWEALKHPFFEDSILANKALWKIYKEGKITIDEHAKILGVTPDYIKWLGEKIFFEDSK